jgi:hypothetical protein
MLEALAATHVGQSDDDLELVSGEFIQVDGFPIVVLPIGSLLLTDSPRQSGESDEHVRALAESEAELPPVIVHGQSMRVIDGIHRIRAAAMRGETHVKAKLYQGTNSDAFVLAVRMNIAHGLPLTRADRVAAAIRIIGTHPDWSDRMIATAVGLAAGTVGKVRRCSTAQGVHTAMRVGKDGRERPANNAPARLKVSQLLAEKPTASIRAIAREAGVSPSTVHNLRRRLRTGQKTPTGHPPQRVSSISRSAGSADVTSIFASLTRDPSLRFSDAGRSVLRWLDRYRIGLMESNKITERVPDHCAGSVARLARTFAQMWTDLAIQLEQRSP